MKDFNWIYKTNNVIEAHDYKEKHSNAHLIVDLSNAVIYFSNQTVRDAFIGFVNTYALDSFTAETKLVEFDDVTLEKLTFSDDVRIRLSGNVVLYDFFAHLQSSYILTEDNHQGRNIMYYVVPNESVKSTV